MGLNYTREYTWKVNVLKHGWNKKFWLGKEADVSDYLILLPNLIKIVDLYGSHPSSLYKAHATLVWLPYKQ